MAVNPNWEALRAAIMKHPMRRTSVIATIPKHVPEASTSTCTEGIYPVRDASMCGQTCVNGIYQSRSHGDKFFSDRNVYIQDGYVQLVTDESKFIFRYDFFFDVNKLGEKVAELPTDLNLRAIK